MIEKNQGKEKLCMFFASDYHFEMVTIPYIKKGIDKHKKIIMITENNLDETVQKVLSRVNLSDEQKNKIKEIDWKNDNLNKIEDIKNENKNAIIFIKGTEEYVEGINKSIKDLVNNKNIEVIDCYDINKIENEVSTIAKKYNKILSTSGVEKLLK